jgi:outer membrane immunogenic protein
MKRVAVAVLAGVAAVVGLGHAASAADLAIPPPPPPPPSWTGFYIGVHAGAAWQSSKDWNFVDPFGHILPVTLTGSAPLGAVGGIQGGYNWQFAPAWVLGVEGDISWSSLGDNRGFGKLAVNNNNPIILSGAPLGVSC